MARRFKKRGNPTSSAQSTGGSLGLKLKSPSPESLAAFNSKLSMSIGSREQSPVSWKLLSKRSPWLKQLKPHQKSGVEAIVSTNGFAAIFAQRTGKTWVTGAVLEVEYEETHDVLLLGPLTNLKSTWEKFLAEKLPRYTVHRDFDSYLEHKKVWKKQWGDTPSWNILLLNPDRLNKKLENRLRRIKWDRFIWDEAQVLKNRTTAASRSAGLVGKSAKKRLALTGTPMDSDPKDLWAIMRFVAPEVLGTVWKDFDVEFLVQPKIDLSEAKGVIQRQKLMLAYMIAKRKAPIREDMLDTLAELISPHVMRISREDAGFKGAKVKIVQFDLDPQEQMKYTQLEKTMVVKHHGKVIKTPLKITQIGKLQQITGGHIKDEDGEVHRIGTSKRRLLRKLIAKHIKPGDPFVIFCKFVWEVHALERMMIRAGYPNVAKLWGGVKDIKSDPRRTNMLLAFQRGEIDVMVCQQRTGGVGVDLYRARKFFGYSLGHSFITYDQMLSRGDFLEQKERAKFFMLAARKSIDIDILGSVDRKKSISDNFYRRLN